MFINGAPLLFALLSTVAPLQGAGDQGPAVRRLAATAQLAAQEYRIGVSNGRIVAQGTPPVTVRLVDWCDEEGARFGRSLFGSSAVSIFSMWATVVSISRR